MMKKYQFLRKNEPKLIEIVTSEKRVVNFVIKIVCKSINRDTQVASKRISVNFSICIRRDDENVVGLHAPISYPVNRKREMNDRKSAFILSSGLVRGTIERCDQSGRSKEKKKTTSRWLKIKNLTPDRGRLLMQMGCKVGPNSETGILEVLMHEVFEML